MLSLEQGKKGVLTFTNNSFNLQWIGWDFSLTWLPSLCQKMAGCGLPVASHWKVTVRPNPTTWFLGRTANTGGTEVCVRERVHVNHWSCRKCDNTPLRSSHHDWKDNKTLQVMLLQEDNQRRSGVNVTTVKSIIFLQQHVLECFIPFIPQQFANDYNVY